jgi:oxygen-independent coproporphyrinogen-3 oxidase
VELNPADVSAEWLATLARAGVNRLSLGVQSFDDHELRLLGRRHTSAGAARAIEQILAADFAALCVDLIYALPGADVSRWRASLERALGYRPAHISCYALTVASGTRFGDMREAGELALPDEQQSAALFMATSDLLTAAGYEHYEVSNFAREPGLRSQHNQKYWRRIPTLGLGPAAHSFDGARRWANVRDVDRYHEMLAAGDRPVATEEQIDDTMARTETIALGMRTSDGVAMGVVLAQSGAAEAVGRLIDEGLVIEMEGRLYPTRRGFLVADGIAKLLC